MLRRTTYENVKDIFGEVQVGHRSVPFYHTLWEDSPAVAKLPSHYQHRIYMDRQMVNNHLRLNTIVRGNWFLSSGLTASKVPGHMGTISALIPLENGVTFFFPHHLKTETVLGRQFSALLHDVQGLIKETHLKGNHMNDKNKQKGIGERGTLAYPNILESKCIYAQFSGNHFIPSSDTLIFLMSHFIFFKNTYILKMFSLWINFFYLTEVNILVPTQKNAMCFWSVRKNRSLALNKAEAGTQGAAAEWEKKNVR